MAKFIEESYCSNLDPQARSIKQNKTVQKIVLCLPKKYAIIHL